jgi:hypothetical protein
MNSAFRFIRYACLATMFLGSLAVNAQRGARVVPRNLSDLVARSAVIVRGHVVSATVEPHPEYHNISTVVVEFQVDSTSKGAHRDTIIIRQFIWDTRDRADAAGYRKGKEYLLMLNEPTRLGLQSTVGLEQGRFRIETSADGTRTAVNGYANRGLFSGIQEQVVKRDIALPARASRAINSPPEKLSVEALQDLITALVEAH